MGFPSIEQDVSDNFSNKLSDVGCGALVHANNPNSNIIIPDIINILFIRRKHTFPGLTNICIDYN